MNESSSSEIPETLQNFLSLVGIVNTNTPSSSILDLDGDYIRYTSEVSSTLGLHNHNHNHNHSQSKENNSGDDDDGDDQEEDIFESSFDLSQERLQHFFHMFDTDSDGLISYDSLKSGLEYHLPFVDDRSFQVLVQHLDLDQSGDLSFDEFAQGIRLMMLRALFFHTGSNEACPMQILDYDSNRLEQNTITDGNDTNNETNNETNNDNNNDNNNSPPLPPPKLSRMDVYFQSRPKWIRVRWINVLPTSAAAAALTMKRLAVKFSLHPLALEDALTPNTHRPKVEVFANHYLIMVPILSLEIEDEATLARQEKDDSGKIRGVRKLWKKCRQACCGSLRRKQEQKTKILQERRPSHAPKIRVEMVSIFVNVPGNDTVIILNNPNTHHRWYRVQQELEKRYSKLRQYDAQYLTYALLDHAVDLIRPVVKQLRKAIQQEGKYLAQVRFRDNLDRIHAIRRELEKSVRKLKPFLRLLTHVIEDEAISPGATLYLKDVFDNLECEEEELRNLIAECHGLDADADKFQSRQRDQTLYTLTVVSSVFLPAQFLTGVWGMNFEQMPELDEPWAYRMFWGVTVFMSLSLLVALNFGRLRY